MIEVVETTTTTTFVTGNITSYDLLSSTLAQSFLFYLNKLGTLPGGQVILRYIKSSYKDDPIRSLFELSLVLFAIRYFLSPRDKPKGLSEKDIIELCDEWQPEPLAAPVQPNETWQLDTIPMVDGANCSKIDVEFAGKSYENVLNMASLDFLNFNDDSEVKEAAKKVINASGVGACGPPNFYGTQDSHVRFEEDLADFLDADRAILYGQDFTTATSVIPAFLKRGDLCIADSGINIALQKALVISRCRIIWFNHNDYDHLKEVLEELKPQLAARPLTGRFIISEGIFANSGDIPDLAKLVEFKNQFKYRLLIDESLSVGVLGKSGKGIADHYNIPRKEIDVTIGSMAISFASSGGWCVGAKAVVHHQRLQSHAYVFSAALPPYSARVASVSIEHINRLNEDGSSKVISSLQSKIKTMYDALKSSRKLRKLITIDSHEMSPIIHVKLNDELRAMLDLPEFYGGPGSDIARAVKRGKDADYLDKNYNLESYLLNKVNETVLVKGGILTTRSKRILHHEIIPIVPALYIIINDGLSIDEIKSSFKVIEKEMYDLLDGMTREQFLKLEEEL